MAVVSDLAPVGDADRQAILEGPRTSLVHRNWMSSLQCMNDVRVGCTASRDTLPASLSVVAWNVERCLFPTDTAARIAPFSPDIVLLSEVDCGMARTGQRHTTADVAAKLGMAYAFGVEFFELGLGGVTERDRCTDDFNADGWHGNAILSAAPILRVGMLRLDDHGHWFVLGRDDVDPDQPRIGGRMALMAEIATENGPVCAVSTHLESNAKPDHRAEQFDLLMDRIDAFAPDMPVIIGGDLNTGNHVPPDFSWTHETLFKRAEARGYDWSLSPEGMTTQPSLITPHPARQMRLDWFATRGMTGQASEMIEANDPNGRPLSDHHAIWCRVQI